MTGFGLSKSISKQSDAYVEIKGVNHKFLDISLKSNDLNNELEEYIRNSVSKKIVRGRVEIKVKFNAESKISGLFVAAKTIMPEFSENPSNCVKS